MSQPNSVMIGGNLVRDPELRQTKSVPVCNTTIAVNHQRKVGQEYVNEASFIDLTLFGRIAEKVVHCCRKGDPVLVMGRLKQESWVAKDGAKRSKICIVAEHVYPASKFDSPPQHTDDWSRAPAPHAPPDDQPINDEDIPF